MVAVEQEAFDLILMDIRMARMSGIEALERIKAITPRHPRHHHDRLRRCGNRRGCRQKGGL